MSALNSSSETKAAGSFGRIARRGAFAVGLAQGVKILIQFLSVIVLARLLTPDDFGLIASVTPLVAFVSLFQDIGLQQAVVQREKLEARQLNQIFWLTVALGMLCATLVVSLGPGVVWFYGDTRLLWLTAAIGAPLFFQSLASVPMSLLNRRMQFKSLAIIDSLGVLLGFLAAAWGALKGLSYWSLALPPAVTALVNLVGSTGVARWRPGFPNFALDREIVGFGANITGYNLANFFSRNLDNILIGRFRGSLELGYYDRAYKLLLFPLQNLTSPLGKVMLPVLSRVQDDKARVRGIYIRTVGLLALVAIPGVAAVVSVPDAFIRLCFGERWLPVAPIFSWLGIAGLLQPVFSTASWLFISQGKTRAMFRWGTFNAVSVIAAILIGLRWGAVGVAMAYAINDYLVRLPVLYRFMGRIGPVRVGDFMAIQFPLLVAAGLTWLLVRFELQPRLEPSGLPIIAATVAISYGTAIVFFGLHPAGRQTLREGLSLVRQAVVRRRVS